MTALKQLPPIKMIKIDPKKVKITKFKETVFFQILYRGLGSAC